MNARAKNLKYNILVSLLSQLVALICGFVVPRLLIKTFGSEAYGATTSILQFLAYISLLEGGLAGVARAALYKPLAENDIIGISKVVNEIKRLFRNIAYAFLGYTLFLAIFYKSISGIQCYDWISTFWLVIAISISTFGQYFLGISNNVLLQAAQKTYITQTIGIIATILNTIVVIILVKLGCNLIIVKFASSCVFVLKPIASWYYVNKKYKIIAIKERNKELLAQKWTGLGQHFAFFLHSNTDVVVLTIFTNLTNVSIYSIYSMIISHVQSVASSFTVGMEALFGDMLAKDEKNALISTFNYFETLISIICIILFSTTAVLMLPFIKLYTSEIHDANYIQPGFGYILLISAIVNCTRMPYHSLIIASGRFKETRLAAYGEAALNIILSIALVNYFGLIGVAVGTVVAVFFRFLYYVYYLKYNIINRDITFFVKRLIINILCLLAICYFGTYIISKVEIGTYFSWLICAIAVFLVSATVTIIFNYIFYKREFMAIMKKITRK